ncbi:uncharacterized protein LOC123008908 [Tribolium madens]|uniref:uncharacterized protein LOC123008908 n=1 Tax=Tribolium madens TaxID=41895 RepID=UPI001CF72DD8|nr:uncharacterized protein LOC123008908 [Tribolium madens]
MFSFIYLLFVFLLSNSQQCLCLQYDYYWRDFIGGEVPRDAIVAGQNIKNKNIYIGQAYVNKSGLITGEIFSGVTEVYIPMDGIQKIDKNIKILCGTQQNLYWMPTNGSSLSSLLVNHIAVTGGYEYATGQDYQGILYIGRLKYNGEYKIGKIVSYYGPNMFLFNDNMSQVQVSSYEVLLLQK